MGAAGELKTLFDDCPCESLPDVLLTRIFTLLPPRAIAGACASVCRAWRAASLDPAVWQHFCDNTGLRTSDELKSGGWRALYIAVYGPNLVGSPHFQKIPQSDVDFRKNKPARPWEPKHRISLNRITVLDDEDYEEFHSYSHWAVEGGSQFHRGGGDGIVWENPPVGCEPCPACPGEGVVATSREWGRLQQFIGLQSYPNKFLDECPPFLISAWFAAPSGTPGSFRLYLLLRDDLKNCLTVWDSTALNAKEGEWQEAKFLIKGYPQGVRSVMVKLAGKSNVNRVGFYGSKFTNVHLRFVSVAELGHYTGCPEGVFVQPAA